MLINKLYYILKKTGKNLLNSTFESNSYNCSFDFQFNKHFNNNSFHFFTLAYAPLYSFIANHLYLNVFYTIL